VKGDEEHAPINLAKAKVTETELLKEIGTAVKI